MARTTRAIFTLVAVLGVAPLSAEAQNWTSQNINGLTVWSSEEPGLRRRAVQAQYGWYIEVSFFDNTQKVYAMQFQYPQFQQSDRIDYVWDTNKDGVFDTGYQWIVGRGWFAWQVSDIGPFRVARDQAYSQYLAAQGTRQAEPLRLLYVRADKFHQTMDQMLRRGY